MSSYLMPSVFFGAVALAYGYWFYKHLIKIGAVTDFERFRAEQALGMDFKDSLVYYLFVICCYAFALGVSVLGFVYCTLKSIFL